MTLCPVALATGCKNCAIFSMCPVKGLIGDYRKDSGDAPRGGAGSRKKPR